MSDDNDDGNDERILDLLISANVVAACEQLFTWRTIDAELAELEEDRVADAFTSGVRSAALIATMSFGDGELRVEMEYDSDAKVLSGQIFPPGPSNAVLHRPLGEPMSVEVSATGTFLIAAAPAGPLQIRIESAGLTAKTDWIVLDSTPEPERF